MPHSEEHKYIPKNLSKEFRTRHGCECKEEYEYIKKLSGKKYRAKKECVMGNYSEPWCRTKNKCGKPEGTDNSNSWDFCLKEKDAAFFEQKVQFGEGYYKKQIKGILFFIIIFVLLIPILLYKLDFQEILEVYMPNFDLLATALSFQDGATGLPYFQELYGRDENSIGWLSTLLINYLSLLGLTFLVARRVHITKSLSKGWGIGFVMLLLTYLVPNIFITYFQNKSSVFLQTKFIKDNKNINNILGDPTKETFWPFGISNILVILIGLFIASMFILMEVILLRNQKYWLDPIVNYILTMGDFLDKI